ncbi:unnamed protein product [Ectocarpus sp. CCAP 1310/34]|nr:unnamed protein product [Ectocarpus sp. CCAP 1310/34]
MDRSRMSTNAFERVSRVASGAKDAESIAVSLGATDLDIELVDNEVRRALAAIHGTKKETYAGRTNETAAGVSYLKKQLERLMKEKAQFKEKKLALQQLQQELPKRAAKYAERREAPAPAPAAPAAAAVAAAPAATGGFLSSLKNMIISPAPAEPSPAATVPTPEEDRQAVADTTLVWKETVTSGTYDAPKKTAALYAEDAVLWGTVSEEVRDTPEQIYAYFDYFARLPELRVVEYTPVAVRVYGDFAVQAGTYTFAFQGPDGVTVEKRARFSFTFRRGRPGSPRPWTIVEHHSSSMPTAPAGLKRVGQDAMPKKIVKEITPDQKAVAETTIVWKDTVTLGTDDAPKKTAALYAPDAVLWGTVSEEVRETPEQIYDYFDFFARLPKLRLLEYTPAPVRVYGEFAVQAGTYTFAWEGDDGDTVEKRARFSFTFRRGKPGSPRPWTIVEHHSSSMPDAPAELKHVEPEDDGIDYVAQAVADLSATSSVSSSTLPPSPPPRKGQAMAAFTEDVNHHSVDVTANVGSCGLGLVLGKEEQGTRWVVNGFRSMPDGKPNPAEAAGIEVGDTLQRVGGVPLGTYKEGIELFKKLRGPVVLTVCRQNDEILI